MHGVSVRTVRFIATRFVIATGATAVVCSYCSGLAMPTPRNTAAAIVDTATIVSAPSTIGIADSDLYGESQADINTTLDTLQSIGVQNIRIFVPWAFVEPANGTYDWSYLDEVVDAAAARNMGVLAEVSATPAWDAPSGTLAGAGTPNPADYASFLTKVATRYGNDISSYEIWNEPNYVASYDPIDPATYTALLKAAYPAIKEVDPTATVIAGALGSVVSYGNLTLDPVTFVQDMLADGAAGYFDALSFHPYQESLEFSQGATVANSPLSQLNAIEQLLVASGLGNDKVWLTEYGLPTSDVSQQTQATYIQNLIDTWQNVSYAGPIFIYTAQDGTSTDPTGTYGIYQSDWTPKLAVAVIQQEIAKFAAAQSNPLAVLGQQIAAAFAQAVAQLFTQTLGQQIANALVQAIAKALASLGTTAPAVATAAVTTPTQTVAALVHAASVPAVAAPAAAAVPTPAVATNSTVAAKATPAVTTPAVTTPAPATPVAPATPTAATATPAVAATPAATTSATAPTASPKTATSTPAVAASSNDPSPAKANTEKTSPDKGAAGPVKPDHTTDLTTNHAEAAHRAVPSRPAHPASTGLGAVAGTTPSTPSTPAA